MHVFNLYKVPISAIHICLIYSYIYGKEIYIFISISLLTVLNIKYFKKHLAIVYAVPEAVHFNLGSFIVTMICVYNLSYSIIKSYYVK